MPRKSDNDGPRRGGDRGAKSGRAAGGRSGGGPRSGGERSGGRDGAGKKPFRAGGSKPHSGRPNPGKPSFGKASAGKPSFKRSGGGGQDRRDARPRFDKPDSASRYGKSGSADRAGKPRFDEARSGKPRSDKPRFERTRSDAPRSGAPRSDAPRSERSRSPSQRSESPRAQRPRSDRPQAGKPRPDKPYAAKSYADKPRFEKSHDGGDRKSFSRPRPEGAAERPRFDKQQTGAPRSDRPTSDRSRFDKPRYDKPRFDKPRAPRPAAAASGERPDRAEARPHKEADRIARAIARAGLCSRREAEDWIVAGRVAVNGAVISSPALDVTARDKITVDGAPLPQRERTRLFLFHKPSGVVTTNLDPEGRPTIFDRLPNDLPRLLTVGRLDIGTEGLLLLTNDGGLSRVLELPETGWLRRYRVRANGQVTQPALDALRGGVTVDGIDYGPIDATLDREQGANVWITFAIREGKNREVRNVMSHLGLLVNRLIRVSFGPFQLGELAEGAIEEVRTRVLRDQLGERVAAEAGCDFGAPIRDEAIEPAERSRRDAPPLEDIRPALSAWAEHPRSEAPRSERTTRTETRAPRGDAGGEARNFDRYAGEPSRASSSRSQDDRPDGPMGRPRRGHAWRSEDSPLRTHYRGGDREPMRKPPPEDTRTGLVKDRKGRSVTVERFGDKPEKKEAKRAPKRFGNRDGRPPRLDTQDPRQDPRGERKGRGDAPRSFADRKADGPRGQRKFGKPQGERQFGKSSGSFGGPPRGRDDGNGPRGRSFDGPPRGDRPGDRPGGKPGGKRIGRGDRSSGPRSSRPK